MPRYNLEGSEKPESMSDLEGCMRLFLYTASKWRYFSKGVTALSAKPKVDPEKTKAMQERTRERNLIVQAIKNQGSMTVEELSKITDLEKPKLLKHLIAMRQFGKVLIVGERNSQLVYGLPLEAKPQA
ncbi:MAG TPA: winged helix-turn-helix domain-containing protein [Candidatus Acidoferrum sp.]|jgi:DNA-binding transcriptional ArsR family regulator|nr:winged helix-turn-helix domain-containing protein [Candidatus Acidoferrum sp.]